MNQAEHYIGRKLRFVLLLPPKPQFRTITRARAMLSRKTNPRKA
jgi:hypothetical protein